MKTVLLMGDSIRIGYDKYVKEALKDVCEVAFPADSGRFSQYFLRRITDWNDKLALEHVDVVHWNAGLWDTDLILDEEPLTPIEFYKINIRRICERIRTLYPDAKMIFATSTPVIEERYKGRHHRRNSDIVRYNEAAVEIVKQFGHAIDDLHAVCEGVPKEWYSDATHLYTPEGTQLLANAVVHSLCAALEIPPRDFTIKDYTQITEFLGIA